MSDKAYAYLKGSGEEPKLETASEEYYNKKELYEFYCPVCNGKMSISRREYPATGRIIFFFTSRNHVNNCEKHKINSGSKPIPYGDYFLTSLIFTDMKKTKTDVKKNTETANTSESVVEKKDHSIDPNIVNEWQNFEHVTQIISLLNNANLDNYSIPTGENTSIPLRTFLISDANYDHYRSCGLNNLDGIHLLINPQRVFPEKLGLTKDPSAVYCAERLPKSRKNNERIYFKIQFISTEAEDAFKHSYYRNKNDPINYIDPRILVVLGDFKKEANDKFTLYTAEISDRCFAKYYKEELADHLLIK